MGAIDVQLDLFLTLELDTSSGQDVTATSHRTPAPGVITSDTHGIEGWVGSRVGLMFIYLALFSSCRSLQNDDRHVKRLQ